MPTQQTTYNSRVTSEALEKKFRDTFTSQGGAELVDDLYASGVVVPIVDFTAAAQGSELSQNLQTAWDFATTSNVANNTTQTAVSTPGFWKFDLNVLLYPSINPAVTHSVYIDDGATTKTIWSLRTLPVTDVNAEIQSDTDFVVFLRSGDSIKVNSADVNCNISWWTRQIADVSGNLVNPLGFTSS